MNLLDTLSEIKQRNRSILVVGLGISGVATAQTLKKGGFSVVAVDRSSEDEFVRRAPKTALDLIQEKGIELLFQMEGEKITPHLIDVGLCVLSPGISLESSIVGAIQRASIPIVNELELAIELLGSPTIVVTGSNGKSTTVSLIHEMLVKGGRQAKLCGNVGIPVISLVNEDNIISHKREPGPLVVEASSYQLETCHHLSPTISVWLNISDNHLERHGTLERYLSIKGKVFTGQRSDGIAIFNADDERSSQVLSFIKCRKLPFGRDRATLDRLSSEYALIDYSPSEGRDRIEVRLDDRNEIYDLSDFPLSGIHNRYNAGAALLAARLSGATSESCIKALGSFGGLRHRYQSLGNLNGVLVINDSKSTTVASTCAAVSSTFEAYPDRPLHLLVGGMVKAGSWRPLIDLLKGRGSATTPVICFGGDGRILHHHFSASGIPAELAVTVKDAFLSAMSRATKGDIVLFSPGCASFDEFQNFEKRGEAMEDLFLKYEQHRSTPLIRDSVPS